MNIVSRSRTLVSVCRRVLTEQSAAFRGACSLPKARCLCQGLPRSFTANLASYQHLQHVMTPKLQSHTTRVFSEMCSGSSDPERSRVSQEESQETDNDSSTRSQRSPESFTLDVLVTLLRQENAVDICVIKVPEHIKYAEYFIVVSGVSPRHLRAMALYAMKVYKFLKKDGAPHGKLEGKDAEDWMCIDFGNMVVHFMLPETREVYELEKLWTLRTYDEQLMNMPIEKIPEDFIYNVEDTK